MVVVLPLIQYIIYFGHYIAPNNKLFEVDLSKDLTFAMAEKIQKIEDFQSIIPELYKKVKSRYEAKAKANDNIAEPKVNLENIKNNAEFPVVFREKTYKTADTKPLLLERNSSTDLQI